MNKRNKFLFYAQTIMERIKDAEHINKVCRIEVFESIYGDIMDTAIELLAAMIGQDENDDFTDALFTALFADDRDKICELYDNALA